MIGIFDSGIGGLSILRALRVHLPNECFVYYADSAHNPYGDKPSEEVIARSLAIAKELVTQHAIRALVVACNTATAAAIHLLRQHYPSLPIVGVEPALKPAVAASKTKQIAVLATRSTLTSQKFLALKNSLDPQATFSCVACTGLADLIERASAEASASHALLGACQRFLAQAGHFDTLVLGCTHYALISDIFKGLVGECITVIDNSSAVALRLTSLLEALPQPALTQAATRQSVTLHGSGDPLLLQLAAKRWLS